MKEGSMDRKPFILVVVLCLCLTGSSLYAQQITTPRISPEGWVKQTIGISTIEINYHRPGVKERTIWGGLVPYGWTEGAPWASGNPYPWRAGADENTTITFSHDVKINGKPLAAGTYALFVLVEENQWTFILSNNASSWGSYFYDEKEDALRVTVKPESAPHQEWLRYGFDQLTPRSARVFLHWEKLLAGFNAEFDVENIVVANIKNELRGPAAFSWQSWQQAAMYCLQFNTHLDLGLDWINKSIQMNENANNRNILGYILFAQEKQQEGIKVFQENAKKYPDNWNIWDSLAEGYAKVGDNKNAIKNYEKALKMAPAGQQQRITKTLEDLKK
jgi:tetratricopeptide (TPR) repeat protein